MAGVVFNAGIVGWVCLPGVVGAGPLRKNKKKRSAARTIERTRTRSSVFLGRAPKMFIGCVYGICAGLHAVQVSPGPHIPHASGIIA